MAHSLSAKKRIRQNEKRNARNRARKDKIRTATRDFTEAVDEGNLDEAEQKLRAASQILDRVASTHTIHKNTAARRRSRMAKALNKAKAAGTSS
jgi:small subunit ribosomal protein S20